MNDPNVTTQIGRRAFLNNGALVLASTSMVSADLSADELANPRESSLRVGLVTDMHYADKPPAGTRHYRESLGKLEEAAGKFEEAGLHFLVELGDFIDAAASVDAELSYLRTVNAEFTTICADRHYVLGNHCVDTLTKSEFLGEVGKTKSYYSFDRKGFHFVVLDSCFRADGKPYQRRNFKWTDANLPEVELDWLQADLNANQLPVIVFAHQRLDVNNNHGVKNNSSVRKLLESSGNVLAVFQGHSHQNDLTNIRGIHYCTLVAMVEGSGADENGYSVMKIEPNGTIRLNGFRKQQNHWWPEDEPKKSPS